MQTTLLAQQFVPLMFITLFITGLGVALIDTLIPVFIGQLVTLMQAENRRAAFDAALPTLLGMPFQQFLPVFQESVLHVGPSALGLRSRCR